LFEEGIILYFNLFHFKNGKSEPKPKYFIVLTSSIENTIIASLPTSRDSIPKNQSQTIGCIEIKEANFNCYSIPNNKVITTCNKKFPVNTFIYAHEIDSYKVDALQKKYLSNKDYKVWGKIKPRIFTELIKCLKNSNTIKRRFKKALSS